MKRIKKMAENLRPNTGEASGPEWKKNVQPPRHVGDFVHTSQGTPAHGEAGPKKIMSLWKSVREKKASRV